MSDQLVNDTKTIPESKKRADIPWGVAGLILVSLRLLQLAHGAAKELGDVYWFLSSFGIMAALK